MTIEESRLSESYTLKSPIQGVDKREITVINYAKSINTIDLEYLDSLNAEGKCKNLIEKYCKWVEYITSLSLEEVELLDSEDLAFLANKAHEFIKKFTLIMYPELNEKS